MTATIGDEEARILAAQAGVALDDEAAVNAATAMAPPLAAADRHARTLAFEAEPSQYLAAQRRAKR